MSALMSKLYLTNKTYKYKLQSCKHGLDGSMQVYGLVGQTEEGIQTGWSD